MTPQPIVQTRLAAGSLAAFFAVSALHEITQDAILERVGYALGLLCFVAGAAALGTRSAVRVAALALLTACIISALGLAGGTFMPRKPALIIANFGVALAVCAPGLSVGAGLVPLIIWSLYLGYAILTGRPPDEVFVSEAKKWGGENHVSSVVICAYVSLRCMVRSPRRWLIASAAFGCAILCAWGRGRSGILAAAMVMLGALYEVLGGTKRNWKLQLVAAASGAILLVGYVYFSFEASADWLEGFRDQGLEDSGRLDIWFEYLDLLTPSTFLVGVPTSNDAVFILFEENLHNSYLMLHSQAGIWGIALCFLIALGVVRLLRDNPGLAFAAIALCFRLSFDWLMFFTLDDYLAYVLIIAAFRLVPLSGGVRRSDPDQKQNAGKKGRKTFTPARSGGFRSEPVPAPLGAG